MGAQSRPQPATFPRRLREPGKIPGILTGVPSGRVSVAVISRTLKYSSSTRSATEEMGLGGDSAASKCASMSFIGRARVQAPMAPRHGRFAMRHDPASAAIVIMLRSLKMYGMAQSVSDLPEQGSPAFGTAVPVLSQLLKAETAEREFRSSQHAFPPTTPIATRTIETG